MEDFLNDEAIEFLDTLERNKLRYIAKVNERAKGQNRYVEAHSYFN